MYSLKMKSILLALVLSGIVSNTWAQINSPNLNPNSINGDRVIATVNFPTPVQGDLYLATQIGDKLYFFAPGAPLASAPVAFQKDGQFSSQITVLDFPSDGIPAGTYPLYQVIANAGSDVMQVGNWVGGVAGLSQIALNINLNNTAPVVDGKTLYKDKGCSASNCHRADPKLNANSIRSGTSVQAIKNAIRKNSADMGFLADTTDPLFATDTELQAIANYLKSL